MNPTPIKIKINFEKEMSPAKLIKPNIIVDIKMIGPTTANIEFTTIAFLTSFNIKMTIAAVISNKPENNRNPAIDNTT